MVARSAAAWQGTRAESASWQQALQALVEEPDQLADELGLDTRSLDVDRRPQFPLRVPRPFLARVEKGSRDDPLLRQVLPTLEERKTTPAFTTDPLAEHGASVRPGLIHKYHGRVLLIVSSHCAIHCRYCFRRHFPYSDNRLAREDWEQILVALRADHSLREVILSGGDPLSLPDRRLRWLIDKLAALPQLTRLRIHSRMPVVIPGRITPALTAMLGASRLHVSLVIHANHAHELDESVACALEPLRRAGITLLNQSVLLAGVNDDVSVLVELCERLFAIGVLPYYVHLLDRVAGSAHFEVSEERARHLQRELLARLPGYLVPRFVREQPDAASKVPLESMVSISAQDQAAAEREPRAGNPADAPV